MTEVKGVGAVILNSSNEVLLTRRKPDCDFYPDCWFLPCGTVESGEDPKATVVREMEEELCIAVEIIRELIRRTNDGGYDEIIYECAIMKGGPVNNDTDELSEVRYFPLNALPEGIHSKITELLEGILNKKEKMA
ncbi:NUDIX hydrolase [Candidatus Peregrinibacteria bacterium]|jgi:8-oxo-dGTP diphosphatase|nr:NUDIX hydrolase [Candidatus Peregrinibacteria bacterium]